MGLRTIHFHIIDKTIVMKYTPAESNGLLYQWFAAGRGGSVGYAVRLETRRSRVQPPPRSVTFSRGD